MAELLLEVGIAVLGVALAGMLAGRIGLSVIPAYILVGVLLGPNEPTALLGVPVALVNEGEVIDVLAELGVVFLLFFLGLEFSVDQLLRDRRKISAVGALDFVVNFGIGAVIGLAFGWTLVETLFLAGIVYISSSAVVTKSLIETGWIANAESSPILGTLVFEDILIAVYLALLAAITGGGGLRSAATSVGVAFLFLGGLSVAAWYGAGWFERFFATGSDEQFVLRVVGLTTVVAGAALALGVSEAVAAFFLGTGLSQTTHVERIEHIVAPARDLFAAVFFFAIGLSTDVTLLAGVAGLLAVAVVATTAGKLFSGTLSGRVYGLNQRRSLRVGLGLVPRGEFSLVLVALAASIGTGRLGSVIPAFAVGYVLVMSVVGSVLVDRADGITDAVLSVTGGDRAS
ncbi:cation:proton antiporter [Haloarcula pellucida]|uniref:Potassium transporter n=1 Tax=Haloarcula pellucida TaxID=1427151 RepID=A0A830GKW7_9EURY|nr:cation:proton antiporter [Halomicroarcula pellucida]MBX0350429.1 cation:proton antiporter [Halomicroarcula pellucida]GGN90942.1 potassium transporter [Halomicroarcula pellucida]